MKVALVTGASRGIGKAISFKLLNNGYKVYGISREEEDLTSIAHQYEYFRPILGDITDEVFVFNVIKQIKRDEGQLDCLVNNAGIEKNEMLGFVKLENLRNMLEVNVVAALNLLQLSTRIMKSGSAIVNISSNVGLKGNPGQISYAATKGAINAITLTAAKELASRGIRVNAVIPGLTNTEMITQTDEKHLQGRISNIKLGRMIEPDEVAETVYFLCSDNAKMISGQLLAVDGCTIM